MKIILTGMLIGFLITIIGFIYEGLIKNEGPGIIAISGLSIFMLSAFISALILIWTWS